MVLAFLANALRHWYQCHGQPSAIAAGMQHVASQEAACSITSTIADSGNLCNRQSSLICYADLPAEISNLKSSVEVSVWTSHQ